VERSEAEAIYDQGREACVEFLMRIADRQARSEERLRALEQKASPSSRTGSSPPSADAPKTRQQRRAEAREKAKELARRAGKQKREAGGQPGHPGSGRGLLPEDRMREIVDHYPDGCSGCGREFTDSEKVPRHGPGRHQVAELPATAVFYVEHRTHRLRCPGCRKRTRAILGVLGESPFGPGLQATVVALTARNRISRRDMSELVRELFGVRISVGAIDAICQRTSGLLAGPHERLKSGVLGSAAINIDETGWYLAGENRTMWTATTEQAAIFKIVADRHRDRLEELLGLEFSGIVTSDRWWAYDLLDAEQRQACWSHLQRDFRFHSEGLAAQKEFGEAGLQLTRRLFEIWHAYQPGSFVNGAAPRAGRGAGTSA
jgi:transposase